MIDINLIRENPELVKENIKKKFQDKKLPLIKEILKIDEQWRKCKAQGDNLRAQRNKLSIEIAELKKKGKDASKVLEKAQKIPKQLEQLEKKANELENERIEVLKSIPNIISKETPIGKDENENVAIKTIGKPKNIQNPKTHLELAESLKLVDFDASAKVAGSGFYYIKNDLALLNQALIRFAVNHLISKGYEYIEPPLMLNEKSIYASMDKKAIEDSVYDIKGEDLHLIGTSEQAVLAMHSGNIFLESQLPKKYAAYSMCFRKEVGAHGINQKGLWRTHQFNKVEQFIFCMPEDSKKYYEELLKNSEEIMQALNLPYRVLEICSGDLADWKYRSADIEVWRPTTKSYGEVISLSNCTDYQARKLGIKVDTKKGERKVVHTLNNTALATSRIMVAILENYQNPDGTITIPEVLVPYMNSKTKIEKK
jgi:seryl-tRNA synthetase